MSNEYNHSESTLYHAANVLILSEYSEKSKHYVDQLLTEYPTSVDGYLVKGWLELKSNRLKSARNCFRAVLSQVNFYFKLNDHIFRGILLDMSII